MKSTPVDNKVKLMWKNSLEGVDLKCEYLFDKKKYKISATYKDLTYYEVFTCHTCLDNENLKMNDQDLKDSKEISERLVKQIKLMEQK